MPGWTNRPLLAFVCFSFCLLIAAQSQTPEKHANSTADGVALYERGDTDGAIKQLSEVVKNSKDDARAWHYLGLAQLKAGNLKAAREAFGKATAVRNRDITAQFFGRQDREWRDEQLTNLKTLLSDQIESQTRTLETISEQQELAKTRIALERSRGLADCVDQSSKVIDGHTQLRWADMKIVKARVLSKPLPIYPSSALVSPLRRDVILRAIFMADGSVKYIEAVNSPDRALVEESIRVAKLVRFTPQMFCGHPISTPVQLEYFFMRS